uniref:Uncharacterized protein n=1 Tax=Kalanchoe fedtschenkoi TaxID=63787 RepID=A0A7N0SWG3_KALFE
MTNGPVDWARGSSVNNQKLTGRSRNTHISGRRRGIGIGRDGTSRRNGWESDGVRRTTKVEAFSLLLNVHAAANRVKTTAFQRQLVGLSVKTSHFFIISESCFSQLFIFPLQLLLLRVRMGGVCKCKQAVQSSLDIFSVRTACVQRYQTCSGFIKQIV